MKTKRNGRKKRGKRELNYFSVSQDTIVSFTEINAEGNDTDIFHL